MSRIEYSEEQKNELVTLAQEVGVARAIRELGYGSYPTVKRWATQRGVELEVDPIKQKASRTHLWYKEEEKRVVAQAGLERIFEYLESHELSQDPLTPDDIKKLTDGIKRLVETMALIDGKPTNITQSTDGDDAFTNLLKEFETKAHVSQRDLPAEEER